MECGRRKTEMRRSDEKSCENKKVALMLQQKIALRENVFPSRFLLSVCVCSFECFSIAIFISRNEQEVRIKEKLGQKEREL